MSVQRRAIQIIMDTQKGRIVQLSNETKINQNFGPKTGKPKPNI